MNQNWSYTPKTPNSAQNQQFFLPCNLEIWQMTLQNNTAPLLTCLKRCASFRSHWWIQNGVIVRKHPIWVKISDFLSRDLEILQMTLENNRAPLLCYFKLCLSFVAICEFKWSYGPEKNIGAKFALISVTLTFGLWPWPFALTSLLSMVITPKNFMMIQWEKHSEKGVTDGQTDGQRQTDVFLELLGHS